MSCGHFTTVPRGSGVRGDILRKASGSHQTDSSSAPRFCHSYASYDNSTFFPPAGASLVREIELRNEPSCIHPSNRATSQTSSTGTDIGACGQRQLELDLSGMNAAYNEIDVYTSTFENDLFFDLEQHPFMHPPWPGWTVPASTVSRERGTDLSAMPSWGQTALSGAGLSNPRDASFPPASTSSDDDSPDRHDAYLIKPRRSRSRLRGPPELCCTFCNRRFRLASQLK